jgi:hypothetical protein
MLKSCQHLPLVYKEQVLSFRNRDDISVRFIVLWMSTIRIVCLEAKLDKQLR